MSETVRVEFDMQSIHNLSVELLTSLEADETSIGEGVAAFALSLGRLLSPKVPMTADEEIAFVQALLEWSGAYFTGGGVN